MLTLQDTITVLRGVTLAEFRDELQELVNSGRRIISLDIIGGVRRYYDVAVRHNNEPGGGQRYSTVRLEMHELSKPIPYRVMAVVLPRGGQVLHVYFDKPPRNPDRDTL